MDFQLERLKEKCEESGFGDPTENGNKIDLNSRTFAVGLNGVFTLDQLKMIVRLKSRENSDYERDY